MDGRTNRLTGWTDGQMDGLTVGWMLDELTDSQMDRWMVKWTEVRWMAGQMDCWTHRHTYFVRQ